MSGGDWVVVIPVKTFAAAKSRLRPQLDDEQRAALARAFALDTVDAVRTAERVAEVVVVTAEPELGGELAALPDVELVPESGEAGLTAAIELGIAQVRHGGGRHLAVLLGDLPALRSAALDAALEAACGHRLAFVADLEGTGTTLVTALAGTGLRPGFGPDSAAAHRAAGFADLAVLGTIDLGLRRDVDTVEALEAALGLGVGPRTAEVVAAFADEALPHAPAEASGTPSDGAEAQAAPARSQ
ncbi:2-phospho-L-lactate guanylyltransferase [Agromyces mediolanus]|uniref:2-phospho-L-lactate guanylyltransferase n=1 Tax=Agromyces mediolanus TaxID=41986 RepID=UPI00203DE129|nr:2-phospho-L-lactate guanylyltransferase [Agromyces mediolanus]MCM3657439.1 2-phospho-L-lactate guanylyltransferase [Agromyces mediolanus]